MKNNETFLQVWDYLIDNKDLDVSDVLLMSKILSFTNANLPCYISNEEIRLLLRLKNIETASRRVSKLEKMGYIKTTHAPHPNNPKKTIRYITSTYKIGLTSKSRVDSEIKGGLTSESRGVDFKVKGGLTSKSINNINILDNILDKDNILDNTSILGKKSWEEKLLLESIEENVSSNELKEIIKLIIDDVTLTRIQKEKIIKNKSQLIEKVPVLKNILVEIK
jgi:hypothetical protein